MGYFDIDGVRYWDIRDKEKHFTPAEIHPEGIQGVIPSDSTLRDDYIGMLTKTMEEAQIEKERLENEQRYDRKLREAVEKRRTSGGPKFAKKEESKS